MITLVKTNTIIKGGEIDRHKSAGYKQVKNVYV